MNEPSRSRTAEKSQEQRETAAGTQHNTAHHHRHFLRALKRPNFSRNPGSSRSLPARYSRGDLESRASGTPSQQGGGGLHAPRHSELTYDTTAAAAEFIGTFIFLWLSFTGAQSASFNRGNNSDGITTTDNQTILFIALSFGMSLVVTAWVFFRITGAAFNPAVTLSLWLVGSLTSRRAVMVVVSQFLGGLVAAGISKGLTLSNFAVSNTLVPGLSKGKGLAIELFTTFILIFTVLMMAAEKHRGTFLAPVCIGLALFVGHLASVGWTGAGMNPARTLGPSVVNASFPGYAWIYYLGQLLGALLATFVYVVFKHLDYQHIVESIDTADVAESQPLASAPIATAMAPIIPGGLTSPEDEKDQESGAALRARSRSNPMDSLGSFSGPGSLHLEMSRKASQVPGQGPQ